MNRFKRFFDFINEALKVDSTEPGKKKVNIIVGRFQPPTLGHVKVLKSLSEENGYPVIVFMVRAKKINKEKTPFSEGLIEQIFNDLAKKHKFIEGFRTISGAGIDKIYNELRPEYEPILWGTGSDRLKGYNIQIQKDSYRSDLNVDPEFKAHEIKRTDDNISASKVRKALIEDDIKSFKSMTDTTTHQYYPQLKDELSEDK